MGVRTFGSKSKRKGSKKKNLLIDDKSVYRVELEELSSSLPKEKKESNRASRDPIKTKRQVVEKRRRLTKVLDPRMTKSFETLARDGKREYSIGLDLDKSTGKRTIQRSEQIIRGKTGAENSGRASVQSPVGTDVTIHNHPLRNSPADKWTRPSGMDIYNMMFRTLNTGDLDEAYIIGPDRQWYRYYLDVKPYSDEEKELWDDFRRFDAEMFDKVIESEYQIIYDREKRISHLNYQDREDYFAASGEKEENKIFQRKTVRDRKKKIHASKNYMREIEKIASRRAWKIFVEKLDSRWKVKIQKVQKNEDGSLKMSYVPDE